MWRTPFLSTRNRWSSPGRPAMSMYLRSSIVALGAEDGQPPVAPGRQAVGGEPVDADHSRWRGRCARCMSPTSCRPGVSRVARGWRRVAESDLGVARSPVKNRNCSTWWLAMSAGCRRSARGRRTRAARLLLRSAVRAEADGVDDLADGARGDQLAGPHRRAAPRNARSSRIEKMRPVSACTRLISASWASVVMPGLSVSTSLPCRIAAMRDARRGRPGWPRSATSCDRRVLEDRAPVGDALRLRDRPAAKAAARSSSAAWKATSSAPARSRQSTWP